MNLALKDLRRQKLSFAATAMGLGLLFAIVLAMGVALQAVPIPVAPSARSGRPPVAVCNTAGAQRSTAPSSGPSGALPLSSSSSVSISRSSRMRSRPAKARSTARWTSSG